MTVPAYPKIEYTSTDYSGLFGGGLLSIYGDYFLTRNYGKVGHDDSVKVYIGGNECVVESVSMKEIKCWVPAGTETSTDPNHYYPGHRGITFYSWKEKDLSLDEMQTKNLKIDENSFDGIDSIKTAFLNNEIRSDLRPQGFRNTGFSSLAPFYFSPPREGTYALSLKELRQFAGSELNYPNYFQHESDIFPTYADGPIGPDNPRLIKLWLQSKSLCTYSEGIFRWE